MGIGGVGGYYGAKLASSYASSEEHKIFFIARGEHLKAIREKGLTLVTPTESFTATPSLATENPEELGPLDLVLVCVKGYGLEDAARLISSNIHADSIVIPLLNGVDNAERTRNVFKKGIVMNGCVYISSHIERPGVVEQTGGSCKLLFGPENGLSGVYRNIENLMENAGINAVLSENITIDVWTKYIFIGPLAGLSSVLQLPLGAIMENEKDRTMLEGMMKEVASVAAAKGINLPGNIVSSSLAMTNNFPYDTKTSMQLDREKGNPMEVDTFIGYIVKTGTSLGVETPLHEKIMSILTGE
ncbi:MAG: 2-dehydropantoate 2-reductase [Thermodesulfobacteriota bacterium]|nr:2-dehydropantoate 2-reductase [Thermodesulfobacteriota bacterium]